MSDETLDFLGGLDDTPAPPPKPNPPAPAPATTSQVLAAPASSFHRILEFAGIAVITAALTTGAVAWWLGGRGDGPKPSADAVALGRSFAPLLAGSLADGFEEGATQLRAGKTMGEANASLKAKFEASRNAAFDAHASEAIHAIVPDGKELDQPSQREAMIGLFTDFAKGLRETR